MAGGGERWVKGGLALTLALVVGAVAAYAALHRQLGQAVAFGVVALLGVIYAVRGGRTPAVARFLFRSPYDGELDDGAWSAAEYVKTALLLLLLIGTAVVGWLCLQIPKH